MNLLITSLVIAVVFYSVGSNGVKPCAARSIPAESVVCVCNSTYCDTITRNAPTEGTFMIYTSSKAGLRFKTSSGRLRSCAKGQDCSTVTLTLHPETQYQSIEGFGGAFTDSAGINWMNLSAPLRKHLIDSYFSEAGLEYNMGRVPIGGCDFSTRGYAYNEQPVDEVHLSNFSLAYEDYQYKIPMIKAAMRAGTASLQLVGTTWSPPGWMKTNNELRGRSRLRPEYFQTYADYHYKFLEKYAAEGVPVWAITTTNEPSNGLIGINVVNNLGWTADSMGRWIVNNLGPTIRNSTFKNVKIIAGDDQRLFLLYWIRGMLSAEPAAKEYIDGVAVHYYTDNLTPAATLRTIMAACPDKFLLASEACEGSFPWQRAKVLLGSWERAHNYIHDIIGDLNNNIVGWLDWNLCLDASGGPNWVSNWVDSPVIVFPERNEFYKQPMFYALGHFSKFIPRGSHRILTDADESYLFPSIDHTAFVTPRKTIVVVLYNKGSSTTVNIKLGLKTASIPIDEHSVVTVELPYETQP